MSIWIDNVKLGQQVFINGEEYVCEGIMLCSSRTKISKYCEFLLTQKGTLKVKWLEVEKDCYGNYNAALYTDIGHSKYNKLAKENPSIIESYKDKAKVDKVIGKIDACKNEFFHYEEIYFENKILSVEIWDGEESWDPKEYEYSYGEVVHINTIQLGDVVKKVLNIDFKPTFEVICMIFLFMFVFLEPIVGRMFTPYCSGTCTKTSPNYCCESSSKCLITNKSCKTMYYSVRSSSSGTRGYGSGSSSFGK